MNTERPSQTWDVEIWGWVLCSITFVLGIMVWMVVGDPISQRKWDIVQVGMKKEDLLKILGTPTSYDGNQLEYSRPLNVGWVEFAFDENDRLLSKNDESAFGSLE